MSLYFSYPHIQYITYNMVTTKGQVAPAYHTGATRLRRKLEDTNDMIVCPGVYDGFSARVAMEVGGFDALYMVRHSHLTISMS